MRLLIYFLVSSPQGCCDAWRSPVSRTGVNLTLAFSMLFCVYWYESFWWVFFFLLNLCAQDQFHSTATGTKGQTRPEPEQCPPKSSLPGLQWDATNPLLTMHSSVCNPAHQICSTGPHYSTCRSNTNSTSTKDSPLSFHPRALGVRQQL